MVSSFQSAILWITCAGMGLGALAIAALGLRAQPGQRHHFVMSFAVCAIAFTAYYAMANGYGIVVDHGREVYFARYIDWLFTTPLLIGGLLLIGLAPAAADRARDHNALVLGALGADAFMILTGLVADLTNDKPVKYGFYAISCIAFLIVLAVLWGPARRAAADRGAEGALAVRLTGLLTLLWFVYPVVWLLGQEGAGVLGLSLEIVIFGAVDLTAKVIYGLVLCRGVLEATGSARPRALAGAGR